MTTTSETSPTSATRTVHTQCVLCEASCGLEITVSGPPSDPQIESIRGHDADPLSRGHICPKALALPDLHDDPDRLRHPVRRVDTEDGPTWQEMGWDEAITEVARRLHEVQETHGRDAVGVYLGNPNVHSLGAMTHGTALVSAIGTRSRFSATSLDQLPHHLLAWRFYGHQLLLPVPDIDRTDLLVLIGTNPMASNGSLWTVPDFPGRLRELRARGGRLVVLDPRRTETARLADTHLAVRPGGDAALLLAILHVLTTEAKGELRPAAYVDGVEEVARLVADVTPQSAATMSGVPAEDIRDLALALARTDRAAVHGRMGVSTQSYGVLCQWAIQTINILTGHLDTEGGVMFPSPVIDLPGLGLSSPGGLRPGRSRVRQAPGFGGELPTSILAEEITTPGPGRLRALVTVAGNPVLSAPDGRGLEQALGELDLQVAIDPYLGETSRHADFVLPPTTPLQREHYDLVFAGLAVRNTARWSPAVLPTSPDERHDWQIARDLIRALVRERQRTTPLRRRPALLRKAAPLLARTAVPPRTLIDLLLRWGTRRGPRLTRARLEATPGGVDFGPLRPVLPQRLRTADRRIDLLPPEIPAEVERLRAQLADPAPEALQLIGRRHQRDNNSWMHNATRLTKGKPRHHLLVHPVDAERHAVVDGGRARVRSRVGEVEVDVRVSDEVMPGVVSLPHGYGHSTRGDTRLDAARALPGVNMNDLTDPDVLEPVSGNAVLNGVPVTLTPA